MTLHPMALCLIVPLHRNLKEIKETKRRISHLESQKTYFFTSITHPTPWIANLRSEAAFQFLHFLFWIWTPVLTSPSATRNLYTGLLLVCVFVKPLVTYSVPPRSSSSLVPSRSSQSTKKNSWPQSDSKDLLLYKYHSRTNQFLIFFFSSITFISTIH